jgi:hypothetical protein
MTRERKKEVLLMGIKFSCSVLLKGLSHPFLVVGDFASYTAFYNQYTNHTISE